MRFIQFGPSIPAVAALQSAEVQSAVIGITAGDPVDPPSEAIESGVVVADGDGWALGSMLMSPPEDPTGHLDVAAARAADIITESADELATVLAIDHPDFTWQQAGLLVVGGALLDLMVGERLCQCGAVADLDPAPKLWMLPDAEVAVGMRCVHNADRQVGAGVMWTAKVPAPGLPDPGELADHITPKTTASALTKLKLRHAGWLAGDEDRFLLLRSGSDLTGTLSRVGDRIADEAYAEAFDRLSPDDTGHPRLMVSRLVFEKVLSLLMGRGIVDSSAPVNRLAWTGPPWLLMTLESGNR